MSQYIYRHYIQVASEKPILTLRNKANAKVAHRTNGNFETQDDANVASYGYTMTSVGMNQWQLEIPSWIPAGTVLFIETYAPASGTLALSDLDDWITGMTEVTVGPSAAASLAGASLTFAKTNLYAGLAVLKRHLDISSTDYDTKLLEALMWSSREIDKFCKRHFYIETGSMYIDGTNQSNRLVIPDFLSISAMVVDTDGDGSWDDETWTENTDFVTWPYNGFPKWELRTAVNTQKSFGEYQKGYKITGEWGYGNGTSTPYEDTDVLGTVADGTTEILTLDTSDGLAAGETILVGSERMHVTAVSGTSATVIRGVNGSTAAAHSSAIIYRYVFPAPIVKTCVVMASMAEPDIRRAGIQMESIAGEYTVTVSSQNNAQRLMDRALGEYVRMVA